MGRRRTRTFEQQDGIRRNVVVCSRYGLRTTDYGLTCGVFALGLSWMLAGCATAKPLMVINASVVDLRAKPQTTARRNVHDPLEETQLLYGERVRLLTVKDGWAYVEAVEQPEFTHGRRWQGYPGWLPASSLL